MAIISSRLIPGLARTTVHLQLVLDRLSPHDAVLNATTFQDLDDAPIHSLLKIDPVGGYNDSATASMPLNVDVDNAQDIKQANAQSANPDVLNILARLRAEKQETARPVESRRPSFSARSGRGVIMDPYLSQLPQSQPLPRSASHRSNPSSELGSLRSQPLASPRKFDDVDELEYMYALLKPKVKHTAKPATDEKIQKTMAASKVRQKLPAGMKIGSRSNSKEDTRVGKSRGRSNSAIEEWRNRNATSDGLAAGHNAELELDAEEQKIIQEHRKAHKQKRMSQDIPTVETLRNDPDPSRPRYVEPAVKSRKSHDILRPAGPSTRPSYMSQDDRSYITPEKQRLMKALAMRRRQLGAGSSRSTNDTNLTLGIQSAQLTRDLAEMGMADGQQDKRTTSQNRFVGSKDLEEHTAPQSTIENLHGTASLRRGSSMAENHNIATWSITRTSSQRSVQPLKLPQIDALDPVQENGPLNTDHRAETSATDGHRASRYLATRSPSPSRLQTPRLPSRRTSHNTQGSGDDLEDGLSPSDSLMEELRLATVQEARMVATTRSPEISAKESPDMLPSPIGVPNAITPSTTGEEVKASPVDSMLNGYPFPRTLDTVLEASSPEPSRKASTVKLNQQYSDGRSPLVHETDVTRRATPGNMPKNERRTSWLDVSRASTHTTGEANFGTFLNLSRTTTGDSSITSPMTPPVKKSHNPRGNSRLPEIHPNARAQDTYAPPSEPDYERTNTMSWGQRMLESSPVKRTPSLSLFTRHRDRRAQSSTDLLHSDASPAKSSRSIRSGRDSTSSMSTVTHHFGRHDANGDQRRSSDVSRYFGGRKSSVASLDPLTDEIAMKRGSGSWAGRTWKRMSTLSATSRNSLTRLGEQCAEDGVTNAPLPVAKVPLAVREPKAPLPSARTEAGPIVIGELNVQLPDSLVCPVVLLLFCALYDTIG